MMPTAVFPVMSYSSSTIFKAFISSTGEDVSAQAACFHVGQKVCGRDWVAFRNAECQEHVTEFVDWQNVKLPSILHKYV